MGAYLKLTGDWEKSKKYFTDHSKDLTPQFTLQLKEDGEMVLEKMKGHIINQDLGWTPLSPHTVELKGGDDTIMIETGTLLNGLTVRKVRSKKNGCTFFIGASPWKTHKPSGVKLNTLMLWLDGGTDKMPPRPLMKPTYEEVEKIIKEHFKDIVEDIFEVE